MTLFALVSMVGAAVGGGQPGWWGWWVVAGVGVYLLHVVMWPKRKCWVCKGEGRLYAPLSRAYRDCDGCGGAKERPRWLVFRRRI